MVVYIIQLCLLIFIVAFLKLLKIDKTQRDNFFLHISFFIFVFIAGFRDFSVGTDTRNYVSLFLSHNYSYMEPGFVFFCDLIHFISDNPTFFLVCCATLTTYLFIRVIKKNGSSCVWGVFIYFSLGYYIWQFNIIRQYIALGFLLNAFYYAKTRKRKYYFLCLLLGVSFHSSAIVGIVFIIFFFQKFYSAKIPHLYYNSLFGKIVLKRTIPSILFVLCITLILVCIDIVFGLARIILPKYAHYFVLYYQFFDAGRFIDFIVSLIILYFYYFYACDTPANRRIYVLCCIVTAIINAVAIFMPLINRIALYFSVIRVLYLPDLIQKNSLSKRYSFLFKICVFISGWLYLIVILMAGFVGASNYQFVKISNFI